MFRHCALFTACCWDAAADKHKHKKIFIGFQQHVADEIFSQAEWQINSPNYSWLNAHLDVNEKRTQHSRQ